MVKIALPMRRLVKRGEWDKPRSFHDPKDIAILNSERAIQKIGRAFAATRHNWSLWAVNNDVRNPDVGGKYPYLEMGCQTTEFIKETLKVTDYNPDEDAINVLFTNNLGNQGVQVSGWILAHRIGHAMFKNAFCGVKKECLQHVGVFFDEQLKKMASRLYTTEGMSFDAHLHSQFRNEIGTMKSSREQNRTTAEEFMFECFAQYLLEGKLRFNQIPKRMVEPKMGSWTIRPDVSIEDETRNLADIAQRFEYGVEDCLDRAVGLTFVM